MQVQLGGTTGLLLLRLMQELGTEDGGGVLSRALGLLDLALRMVKPCRRLRRRGRRAG